MSLKHIRRCSGVEIAFLVDAVTHLSKVEFMTREEAQAENFRKMLLAMAKDVKVIPSSSPTGCRNHEDP